MSTAVSFPVVYAKTFPGGGVVAFSDEALKVPVQAWAHYATNKPDMRQRYVTINNQTHRILWRK